MAKQKPYTVESTGATFPNSYMKFSTPNYNGKLSFNVNIYVDKSNRATNKSSICSVAISFVPTTNIDVSGLTQKEREDKLKTLAYSEVKTKNGLPIDFSDALDV